MSIDPVAEGWRAEYLGDSIRVARYVKACGPLSVCVHRDGAHEGDVWTWCAGLDDLYIDPFPDNGAPSGTLEEMTQWADIWLGAIVERIVSA